MKNQLIIVILVLIILSMVYITNLQVEGFSEHILPPVPSPVPFCIWNCPSTFKPNRQLYDLRGPPLPPPVAYWYGY